MPIQATAGLLGYDKLNRLKTAAYSHNSNELGEELTYDQMGNITRLIRGGAGNGTLDYSYTGNRLMSISSFKTGTYGYDGNGNMTTDGVRKVTIGYNALNLPISVTGTGDNTSTATYLYDADRNKQRSVQGTTIRDYIAGIQYENGQISQLMTEEGRAVRNANNTYRYEYFLKDHLGNTRVTIDDQGGNVARVVQADEYYAFGVNKLRHTLGDKNNYLYNGKEKQDVLTEQYDYGARFYDPVIARLTTIDRFAEKYQHISSYSYAANNPINLIDIHGDSLWVSYAGNNILYNNGGFYNKDGTTYMGKGVKTDKSGNITGYKGFLGQAFKALGTIGGTQEGGALLGELQSSNNNYTIQNSSTNEFVVDPSQRVAGFANQLQTDPQYAGQLATTAASAMLGGAGGIINWNPTGADVWALGGQSNNAASNLGHELFHGRDANRGLLDGRTFQGLKYDEWQATFKENQLRVQMGLPLREYYRSQSNNGTLSPLAPRILDNNNQPIRPTWVPANW